MDGIQGRIKSSLQTSLYFFTNDEWDAGYEDGKMNVPSISILLNNPFTTTIKSTVLRLFLQRTIHPPSWTTAGLGTSCFYLTLSVLYSVLCASTVL